MDLPDMERLLKDDFGEIKDAFDQCHLRLDLFENNTLDIAITGVTGTGKSSLVNALRGLGDDDDNSAKTDVIQGTLYPEKYLHPLLPNVKFWDLPGIGTEEFQAAEYLKQVHFDKYDIFIIVSATRFTENDTKLAREIQKRKKKFYFVRSKTDLDLSNEGRKRDFREEKTLMKIRNNCLQHLEKPRIFLISRWDLDKYDFPLLHMTLEQDLSKKGTLAIAVIGLVGTGKSSLVNAMRGLYDEDVDAAKADVVEGTTCPVSYPHPLLPNVTIWDQPGAGAEYFQAARYLKQAHFDQCDVFIIVSSTCFSDNDTNMAREIQKRKKKVYFVRSKIDVALNIERRKPDFREEATLEKIRSECCHRTGQPVPKVFLISRWELDKFDFPQLQKTLDVEFKDLMRLSEGSQTAMDNLAMEPRDYFASMKAVYNQAKLSGMIAHIRRKLDLIEKTTLDIAITGVTGQGKSSLVNALRGLGDDDDNSAKTDVIQGTLYPEKYLHPLLPNVKFWDLPGIGTEEFQAANYLQQVHFDEYDIFIIVSATRFTENDTKLAQEIQKRKKKFYFVRSKTDIDLTNEGMKRDFREEKTLMRIRNNCLQHLEKPRVFLISRWDLDKYDFPLLQMALEQDLSKKGTLAIAVIGLVGTGKSSLVNAMRGLDDEDVDAAKADVVEGTKCPERYPHPLLSNVTIWDLPGIGTDDFQAARYLKQTQFDQCDVFIVVSSTCFTKNDTNLACEIQKKKKKVYFVRSKIDVVLGFESRKPDFKEEKVLEKIKNDCYQQLTKSDQPAPKVFLISRWDLDKFDFPHLVMTLEEDLDDLKRQVLIMALPAYSKEILEKKKKAMKKVIWMQALLSGALGAIPVPGLSFPCDIAILLGTLRLFCKVFGLDNASISRLARRVNKNETFLRSAIKKTPLASEVTPELVVHLLQKSAVCGLMMGLEFALDFVPVLGSLTGGGLSFATTFYMLNGFLNDAEEDAKNVLAKMSE